VQEGCVSIDNQVAGSYLHGMFDTPEALRHIIAWAGADTYELETCEFETCEFETYEFETCEFETYASQQEHELDRLADACIAHLDWQKIQTFIPVFLEAAAMLAALTYPNLLVHLSSWG
jgi:adenosylcobyric acid synthase